MSNEQERAEFEAWANGRCELHLVNPAGRYSSAITQFAWEAYQAGRAAMQSQPLTVDALAQEIRRVNGNNALGAGALAEALVPFLESALQSQEREDAIKRLVGALRRYMHFGCPVCSGDCFSANPPVSGCPAREAQEAIDHARRIES